MNKRYDRNEWDTGTERQSSSHISSGVEFWSAVQEKAGLPRNGPLNQLMHAAGGAGFAPLKPVRVHHILGQVCQYANRLDSYVVST